MIDREARNKAAETIRHYTCGIISNREFERRYPVSKVDPIIGALNDSLWASYEDVFTHQLVGKNAATEEMKRRIARWLMFLYSETEYRWPAIGDSGFRDLPADSWFGIMNRGLFAYRERSTAFMANGDYEVWPFLTHQEFDDARKRPVLLKGNI